MSEKKQPEKDFEDFENKKLISKALNQELNFIERNKFQKLLKTETWQNYYQRVKEMENRVDNMLFANDGKANIGLLQQFNMPQQYIDLIKNDDPEKHLDGKVVSLSTKLILLASAALILITVGFLYGYWEKHLAIAFVSGLAVIVYATFNS